MTSPSQHLLKNASLFVIALCVSGNEGSVQSEEKYGEGPAVEFHLDQTAIEESKYALAALMEHGKMLFEAQFNRFDGQGRPASTGTGMDRLPVQPAFHRVSGPDSNSCHGCHAQPRSGGGGDIVANVFVLAQAMDPVCLTTAPAFSNERNTLGMMGSGAIEMLAREISYELISIREKARAEAKKEKVSVTRHLQAKGISFGKITLTSDGKVDPSEIEGVDWDLIVKPFHQKGVVVSLREFTDTAMNHHHGMQASERFGEGKDQDKDGYSNELTAGDITALVLFQAGLNVPGRLISPSKERRKVAARGEKLFQSIGCTSCHIPALTLESRFFTEPNPLNPPGTLHPSRVNRVFSFDMTREGQKPRLELSEDGGAIVRAFTDLKRHNLNDDELNHFANEKVAQGNLNGFADPSEFTIPPKPRPTEAFLTRKLWDVGNSMPYGHRGDLTTMTEAIFFHGGEGRKSRDAFFTMSKFDQASVLEFLKTLQVLPDGAPPRLLKNVTPAVKQDISSKLGSD